MTHPVSERRDRWLWPALTILAFAVYLPHSLQGYLTRDLGLYAYAGQTVADGELPYVGVVNRSGPLSHLVPALGALAARAVGADDLTGMRLWFMLQAALCIGLMYLVVRRILDSVPGGVAASALLLASYGFTAYAADGPREKTTMVLLLLLAALATTSSRWFLAGVFVSLATLVWQPVFFVGVTFAVAAALLLAEQRWRALLRIVVGGLLPLAGFLVVYAAAGQLQRFLDCFVLIHVDYTEQPGAREDLEQVWTMLREGFLGTERLLIIGAVLCLVAAAVTLASRERRTSTEGRLVLAMSLALVMGLVWSYRVFNGWPDMFFLFPAIGLGWGWLTHELVSRLPARVGMGVPVLLLVAAATTSVVLRTVNYDPILDDQRANVDAVLTELPGADIASIHAPQSLVLSGQHNPIEHQMFMLGLQDYVDDTWPGGRAGMAEDLADEAPTLIARGRWTGTWINEVLARDYWSLGPAPGWGWYVHKSVGWEERQRLRGILQDLPCPAEFCIDPDDLG